MFLKLKNNNDGFSLVEAMSGIVILTIALFPALGYFTNSIGFVHQTEIRSQAMDIAEDTMEYFKMEAKNDWSELNTAADNFSVDNGVGKNILAGYSNFNDDYLITVEIPESDFVENIKSIDITVSWDSGENNVELSSFLRNGG